MTLPLFTEVEPGLWGTHPEFIKAQDRAKKLMKTWSRTDLMMIRDVARDLDDEHPSKNEVMAFGFAAEEMLEP